MKVVRAWLRLDLRRRWRSLAILALLIAMATGTVLAAVAGARRGASALERLSAHSLPTTAGVLPNTPGFDWRKIAALPEVVGLTKFIVNTPYIVEGIPGDSVGFLSADDAMGRTLEKPIVFKGRPVDSSRDDEVVVTPSFVAKYGKGLGDTLVLELPTPEQLANPQDDALSRYDGPHLTMHIVGVGRSPLANLGAPASMFISPGVVARHPANTLGDPGDPENPIYVNAWVRLRGGEAGLPQLRRDIARVSGRSDIDIVDVPDLLRAGQRSIVFESRCLIAFAAAVLAAAFVLIGQAIGRYAAASTAELHTMRALGMTPRQAVVTAAAGPALAGLAGAAIGALAAYVAAHWFPIGDAALAEPAPGAKVDWVVFGPGIAVTCLIVSGGAWAAAWLALGAARRNTSARRSSVAGAMARGGLPVPLVVGARFALESGRGRNAIPARPALVGAVVGVLGILAAFTFSRGVSDAARHPERFGQTFQVGAFVGIDNQSFGPVEEAIPVLNASPDVAGVSDGRTAVATGPKGEGSVSLWVRSDGPKPLPVVLTSGRMPKAANEVALAPRSVSALHTKVGSQVELDGNRPGTKTKFTVTGTALVPDGPHNGYSDGGWLTDAGYDSIFTGFKFRIIFVTLRSGADPSVVGPKLSAAVMKSSPNWRGLAFGPPDPLTEIANLRQVRILPIVLGCFLALLAIGAVGHALATAVRRRSHDLAVLRAVGMTQWQCRWAVVTQASVLAVIGLLFGVPLGIAVGRTVWRAVADYTPLQYVAPVAVWALLLIVPAALLIANLLAAWPGQRAARLRVAQILRTE
ncbi:MAG: FtsX-like permease family protein [Actinomycetota bacterium]|nr:FtsX-like permease family protein [Actinomycetota bacterium]